MSNEYNISGGGSTASAPVWFSRFYKVSTEDIAEAVNVDIEISGDFVAGQDVTRTESTDNKFVIPFDGLWEVKASVALTRLDV